jgi:hypothetical protein
MAHENDTISFRCTSCPAGYGADYVDFTLWEFAYQGFGGSGGTDGILPHGKVGSVSAATGLHGSDPGIGCEASDASTGTGRHSSGLSLGGPL